MFLGEGHEKSERKTWAVIWLCGAMMVAEIVGGLMFGSIALVADGMHMSTHAGALLLAALAYTYARKHADDPNFTFGTGKLGDLAGFTSAIILAMIALLIGYESVTPLLRAGADPLRRGDPDCLSRLGRKRRERMAPERRRASSRPRPWSRTCARSACIITITTNRAKSRPTSGIVRLEVFEDGVPPRFRLRAQTGPRSDGASGHRSKPCALTARGRLFTMKDQGGYLESVDEIPEPHAFTANVRIGQDTYPVVFRRTRTCARHRLRRDNNMRAAVIHVIADAAVSVLVIVGLLLARAFGWLWMDPLAGIVGACVIASWSYGLIRDTGAILLDMNPDRSMASKLRQAIEGDGDQLADLHLWRLGPGHLGAIVSVVTAQAREADYYRSRLARFTSLSHLTVEVTHQS